MTLRDLLDAYIDHRKIVIRRRTQFLLKKAEERKHIVEGLRIAVDNIDEVIALIRSSKDREDAKNKLCETFKLSPRQSQAIVDMRLGSLTGLERDKLEAEFNELVATIADLNDILAREERVIGIIKEDLDDIEEKFGDDRRTEISDEEIDAGFDIEELITEEMMVVTVSRDGYLKRLPLEVYRAQGRGGRGVRGSDAKEGDVLKSLFVALTHDYLLFFSNLGKVYWLKVYQLPEGSRTAKGRAIANLLPLSDDEIITDTLRVPEFDSESCVTFATKRGTIKKTLLEAYSRPKKGGIRAINLDEGDAVVSVELTRPSDTIMLCTEKGQSIHFAESAVRGMGRTSRGVRGIKLKEDDQVVGMVVADPEAFLLTACEHGHGKRTPIADYPIKGRGGQGVINVRTEGRNGRVVSVKLAREGDDAMFITENGMIVRTSVSEIGTMGRATQGVRLVNLKKEDKLVALEIVSESDLEREAQTSSRSEVGAADEAAEASDASETPADDAPETPAED